MYLVIYQYDKEVNRIDNPEMVIESFLNHVYCWARKIGSISKVKVNDYNDMGDITFYSKMYHGKYVFKEVPFQYGYLNSAKLMKGLYEEKSKQKAD